MSAGDVNGSVSLFFLLNFLNKFPPIRCAIVISSLRARVSRGFFVDSRGDEGGSGSNALGNVGQRIAGGTVYMSSTFASTGGTTFSSAIAWTGGATFSSAIQSTSAGQPSAISQTFPGNPMYEELRRRISMFANDNLLSVYLLTERSESKYQHINHLRREQEV